MNRDMLLFSVEKNMETAVPEYTRDTINGIISAQERTRIVRLCATLSGHPDVAEDLAQEILPQEIESLLETILK